MIDWHNYGHTILALSFKPDSPVVKIYKQCVAVICVVLSWYVVCAHVFMMCNVLCLLSLHPTTHPHSSEDGDGARQDVCKTFVCNQGDEGGSVDQPWNQVGGGEKVKFS